MKKLSKFFLTMQIVFTILTFAGAIFVIASHGEHNAGYAVIPMVFTLIFNTAFINSRK